MSLLMVRSNFAVCCGSRIKKGHLGPWLRTAAVADGLATPGGARFYDYQRLSNKIAHSRVLSSFPCATLIRSSPRCVKRPQPHLSHVPAPRDWDSGTDSFCYFTRIILISYITRVQYPNGGMSDARGISDALHGLPRHPTSRWRRPPRGRAAGQGRNRSRRAGADLR